MTEKLSQLLDGELTELECHRTLKDMSNDHDLRSAWERYHLIRAAMRNELSPVRHRHFADHVASALHSEAPARELLLTPSLRRTARIVGGFAIAASVAMIAVFNGQPESTPVAASPQLALVAPTPDAAKVAVATRQPLLAENSNVASNDAALGADINPYLVQHSQATATMGAWRPYVRVVSHSSDQ